MKKHINRDIEYEQFDKRMNKTYHAAKEIAKDSPWTEEYFNTNFTNQYLEIQQWANEIVAIQEKSPFHEVSIN